MTDPERIRELEAEVLRLTRAQEALINKLWILDGEIRSVIREAAEALTVPSEAMQKTGSCNGRC